MSTGCVYIDWLALLFQDDFDGYMGGDMQEWNRGARTRVKLASSEMSRPPAHVQARRGPDCGLPRYEAEVWTPCPPTTERSRYFTPQWAELDHLMDRYDVHYYDEYVAKWGAKRR